MESPRIRQFEQNRKEIFNEEAHRHHSGRGCGSGPGGQRGRLRPGGGRRRPGRLDTGRDVHGCISGSRRVMEHVFESNTSGTSCPRGSFLVYWGVTGPEGREEQGATGAKGATGPRGARSPPARRARRHRPAGAAGAPGPSGVVSTVKTQLVTRAPRPLTPAARSRPARRSSAPSPWPRVPGWSTPTSPPPRTRTPPATCSRSSSSTTAPVNASFTNDLFNVGAGALENPTPTIVSDGDTINSYYSG